VLTTAWLRQPSCDQPDVALRLPGTPQKEVGIAEGGTPVMCESAPRSRARRQPRAHLQGQPVRRSSSFLQLQALPLTRRT
jgi:hypothetical protein